MKQLWSIGIIFTLVFHGQVLAHGTAFFEFNPDAYQSLKPALTGDVYEVFLPQNDFLRGFDLWLENRGSAGPLTLELFDGLNELVAQKTFTIPTITVEGGQRFHFDFDALVSVVGNKSYALKISSSLPQLFLYYAHRIRLLEYNAPFADQYINGVARVGSEEKEFSFKFALYESQENLPPVISNISFIASTPDKMRLDFNANEPVDYAVSWGLPGMIDAHNLPFTGQYQFCGASISFCSAVLQGVPGQTYNYKLTAKDSWGNEKSVTGTFAIPGVAAPVPTATPTISSISLTSSATPVLSDFSPPVISNLRVVKTTDHSVEIAWQTNEAADSSLLISFTTERLSIAATYDGTLELEHVLNSGATLNQETPYLATVVSRDPANNAASASISFKTAKLSLAVMPSPSVSSVVPTPSNWTLTSPSATSGKETSHSNNVQITALTEEKGTVVISWIPPVDGAGIEGYRIDIFNDKYELVRSVTVPAGTKEQKIAGLPEGDYQAIVYANDKGVFRKVAGSTAFSVDHRSFVDKLFASWLYLAGPLVVLLLLVLRFLHKKIPAPSKK